MLASKFCKCKSLELKMFMNMGGYIFFKILLKTANFTHLNVLLIYSEKSNQRLSNIDK